MSKDWNQLGELVLSELKRISSASEDHAREMTKIKIELSTLRAQAGFFGAIAGFMCSLIPLVIGFFFDKYSK